MDVKVRYEIDTTSYFNCCQLKVYYKYKVSPFKYRRGCYIDMKKNEGLPNNRIYETIDEFYSRVVNRLKNKKIMQNEITKRILKENEELNIKDLAFKLAKEGLKFKI